MKKVLVFLVLALALLALTACGGGSAESADPNCGLYDATSMEMMGFTLDVAEVYPDGFSIELLDGGKAKFNYEGKSYNMKWTLDGTAFHAEGGGAELDGTLSGGVMQLTDVMGTGLNITLVNADAAASGQPAAADADYSWWAGKWYGWRVIYEAGGGYEELIDNGYDVVAEIEVDGATGHLTCWDYDETAEDAIIDAQVSFGPGLTEHGAMTAESGEMFFEELSRADWIADPGSEDVSGVEHMICLEGTVVDSDNSDDWYSYYVFLLPWGMTWDQVEEVQNSDSSSFIYNDMMPFHYEDWYLPQL